MRASENKSSKLWSQKDQESEGGEVIVKFKCYKFSLLGSFKMYEDKKDFRES